MFDFDLELVGTLILVAGIVARPHILKKMGKDTLLAKIIYFAALMIFVFPFYLYQPKLTFTSLDDNSAKELVSVILQQESFKEFGYINNVEWAPFSEDRNLYNIKADVTSNGEPYHIYMQPTCKFFQGCEVTMDKVLVVHDSELNIPVNHIDEHTFEKRLCSDRYVQYMLTENHIRTAFTALFEHTGKMPGTTASQSIKTINVSNIVKSNPGELSDRLKKLRLLNSCRATFELNGDFILKQNKTNLMPLILYLFDKSESQNDHYTIVSNVDYNIFVNHDGQILLSAQPFNQQKAEKLKHLGQQTVAKQETSTDKSKSIPIDAQIQLNDDITELYGEQWKSLTAYEQKYITDNREIMQQKTKKILSNVSRVNIPSDLRVNTHNIIEFCLYPDGNIAEMKFVERSGFQILDDTTKEVIQYAYSRYPRPTQKTHIRYKVEYNLKDKKTSH